MQRKKSIDWLAIISVVVLVGIIVLAAVLSPIADPERRVISLAVQRWLMGIASAAILIVVSVVVFKLRRAASKRRKAKHLAD